MKCNSKRQCRHVWSYIGAKRTVLFVELLVALTAVMPCVVRKYINNNWDLVWSWNSTGGFVTHEHFSWPVYGLEISVEVWRSSKSMCVSRRWRGYWRSNCSLWWPCCKQIIIPGLETYVSNGNKYCALSYMQLMILYLRQCNATAEKLCAIMGYPSCWKTMEAVEQVNSSSENTFWLLVC